MMDELLELVKALTELAKVTTTYVRGLSLSKGVVEVELPENTTTTAKTEAKGAEAVINPPVKEKAPAKRGRPKKIKEDEKAVIEAEGEADDKMAEAPESPKPPVEEKPKAPAPKTVGEATAQQEKESADLAMSTAKTYVARYQNRKPTGLDVARGLLKQKFNVSKIVDLTHTQRLEFVEIL